MVEIKLPSNWNDVTLFQYQELKSINFDDYDSDIEIIIEQISILSGVMSDDEVFDTMDFDELLELMNSIRWVNSEPPLNYSNKFGDSLKLKNINKLKLGEFIDLEVFFTDDYIKNLHLICAIIYKNYKVDDWGNTLEEPYIYDIYSRSELFLDVPISMVYGIIKYYVDFKELITEKYHIIFQDDLGSLEETDGLSDEEIEDINKEIEEDGKKAKWSWPALINTLSGGDITKYNTITDLPLAFIFNELSMRKILNI